MTHARRISLPLAAALTLVAACDGSIGTPGGGAPDREGPNIVGSEIPQERPEPAPAETVGIRAVQSAPFQYERAIHALVPGAPPIADRLWGLLYSYRDSQLSAPALMDGTVFRELMGYAAEVGAMVAAEPSRFGPCVEVRVREGADDRACVEDDVANFLYRAWRRPPSDEEVGAYASLLFDNPGGAVAGVEDAVQATILSPHFVFRTERGSGDGGDTTLDAFERASALAFVLLGGPPSDSLLERAESNALMDEDGMREAAEALLEDPAQPGVLDFVRGYADGRAFANSAIFDWEPEFTDAIHQDMIDEVRHFTSHVLREDDARFETLMSAPYSVLTPLLAEHVYGVPSEGEGWNYTRLPEDERAGLMTMASFLASHTQPGKSPIFRGLFLRQDILCDVLPGAPNVPELPEASEHEPTTVRERIEAHTSPTTCNGCHRYMNPLGFPLESFDEVGRFRSTDNGLPIDTSGTLLWNVSEPWRGEPLVFDDAVDMARSFAQHEAARNCFVAKLFHYAYGRPASAGDEAEVRRLEAHFTDTDGHIPSLVIELVGAPHFVKREVRANHQEETEQ